MKRSGSAAKPMPPRMLGGFEAAYVEPRKPSVWRAVWRRLLGFGIVVVLVALILTAAADAYVRFLSKNRLYTDIAALPSGRPAIVLGTSPYRVGGASNPYFAGRIQAAAELYRQGKATFIIVSGDNRELNYNEPQAMHNALVALGVPADRIVRDFAGQRTLDSVVRAKEVFGQSQVIFVSQGFHNERAICLARHHDIDAVGFNAPGDQSGTSGVRNWLRERLARVRMVLDLYVFDTEPQHLGPREPVPGDPAPAKAAQPAAKAAPSPAKTPSAPAAPPARP